MIDYTRNHYIFYNLKMHDSQTVNSHLLIYLFILCKITFFFFFSLKEKKKIHLRRKMSFIWILFFEITNAKFN